MDLFVNANYIGIRGFTYSDALQMSYFELDELEVRVRKLHEAKKEAHENVKN